MPRTNLVRRTAMSRHWCFTLNNPKSNEVLFDPNVHAYLIGGKEICPTTGTPHIQGYVVFNYRKRLSGVKKWLPRAHWEIKVKKSTPQQCRVYCMKDKEFIEYGELPKTAGQAARQRCQQMWDAAYQNAKRQDLESIPKCMLIRYYHAFKRIAQDNPVIPADLPEKLNLWIVAPTGYGKSTYARDKYPDFYDKAPNKWWIGYRNQPAIICDDFGPKQCEFLGWYMKRWADVFPFPMETKGGGRMIRPEHIVVTSQYTIGECFFDVLTREAIENRFKVLELERWQTRALLTDEVLPEEFDDRTRTTVEYDSAEMDISVDLDENMEDLYKEK